MHFLALRPRLIAKKKRCRRRPDTPSARPTHGHHRRTLAGIRSKPPRRRQQVPKLQLDVLLVAWFSRCLVFSLPARSASLLRPRYHVSVAGPERSAIRRHSARQRTRRHSSQGQRSSRHSGAHRSTTGPAGRQTGSGHAATPPSRTTAASLPPSTVSAIHTR